MMSEQEALHYMASHPFEPLPPQVQEALADLFAEVQRDPVEEAITAARMAGHADGAGGCDR